jgi:hypothetical protein
MAQILTFLSYKNNERELFIDKWEMNEDGSGIAQRN